MNYKGSSKLVYRLTYNRLYLLCSCAYQSNSFFIPRQSYEVLKIRIGIYASKKIGRYWDLHFLLIFFGLFG